MSDCHACSANSAAAGVSGAVLPPQANQHFVAVVGPPNSGKSTLFNRLTGLRQKVANFPGVTVEHHIGRAKIDSLEELYLIDLPGIYSLTPRSEDERVTHDVLKGLQPDIQKPHAVLLVLDSTNLNRHLALAAPILSIGLPTMIALNMADDLEKGGGTVDTVALSRELGCPVVLMSAARGDGVEKVVQFLTTFVAGQAQLKPVPVQLPVLQDVPKCRQWARDMGRTAGYKAPAPPVWTRRLDAIFLHPIKGPLIFGLVVLAVFQTIFTGAQPLMDGVEGLIATSGDAVGRLMPNNMWRSLLIDGVWSGVGSVLVFLPQILLLFLFVGLLEDSGYLARAALIADRTMARIGLQGKSFIPLLSAYACAVPAIMATRTIESKRDRIATILIAPFMTCSARLPVYTLIIAAFIPEKPLLGSLLGTRAAALLSLYVLGFLAAVATAKLLKSSVLKSERAPFVLEMPPYRMPTLQSIGLRLVDRAAIFLKRAGTVILGVAIGLWLLAHLPLDNNGQPPAIEHSLAGTVGRTIEPLIKPLGFNWKIGIGLLSSLAAREVIVGTLGTIYGMENTGTETGDGLHHSLQQDLTFGGAVALLIFFAFAMQCFSTIAVVRRETGGWKWPAVQFGYMTALAYLGAFVAFRLLS